MHHGSDECDEEPAYRVLSRLYHGAIQDWSGIHDVAVSLTSLSTVDALEYFSPWCQASCIMCYLVFEFLRYLHFSL